MISIVPYNPEWPDQFENERLLLLEILKGQVIEVHHVGSTAVAGLCAKPKLDIIAVVQNLDSSVDLLEKSGYSFGGELNIPFRFYFKKRGTEPEINLHVFEPDDPEIALNLSFRDYLRAHPSMRNRYAVLKEELVSTKEMHTKSHSPFSGYNLGKDKLIKEILQAAGFQGLCMRICTHHDEISEVESLKGCPINKGSSLVFYRGTEIIGYAEIETHRSAPSVLQAFFAKEEESYFRKRCERWVSSLNSRARKEMVRKLELEGVKPKMAGSMAKLEMYLEKSGKMPSGPKKVRLFHKDGTKTDFTLE